jgi:hypothetical protein
MGASFRRCDAQLWIHGFPSLRTWSASVALHEHAS